MNPYKIVRNLLIFFLMVYLGNGWLYPTGTPLVRISLGGYIAICLVYIVRFMFYRYKPVIGYAFLSFIGMVALYYLFGDKVIMSASGGIYDTLNSTIAVFFNFGTFFAFYALGRDGLLTRKFWFAVYGLLFVMFIGKFMYTERSVLDAIGKEDVINNASYWFISIFPLVCFFWKRKALALVNFSLLLILVVAGVKRGAIVCAVASVCIFCWYVLRSGGNRKLIRNFLLAMSFVLIAGYILYYNMLQDEYLKQRIIDTTEGNLSGRDEIYAFFWSHWLEETDTAQFLFGNGINATLKFYGLYAHNDWLELLIDFGLLGVIVYIPIFYSIFSKSRKRSGWPIEDRCMAFMIGAIMLGKSMFSMNYLEFSTSILIMQFAYLLTKNETYSASDEIPVISREV